MLLSCRALPSCCAQEEGLLGHWPLDEKQGLEIRDESGQSHPGRLNGCFRAVGPASAALEFSEAGDHARVEHHRDLEPAEELTIEAWFCPFKVDSLRFIVSKGRAFWASGYSLVLKDGRLGAFLQTETKPGATTRGAALQLLSSKTVLTPRTWTHAAFVYSASKNCFSIHLNGETIQQGPAAGRICYLPDNGQVPLIFGAEGWSPALTPYRGMLRNVRIWKRALSGGEIRSHFQAEKNLARLAVVTREEAQEKICTAALNVEITGEDGREMPVCAYLRNSQGKPCFPKNSFSYQDGHFYAFGKFSVKLQPGRYNLQIGRGYEYEPQQLNLDLADRENRNIRLSLKRWFNAPQKGWFAGDHHVHFRAHGATMAGETPTFEQACQIAQAAGLNYVSWKDARGNDLGTVLDEKPEFIARIDHEGGSNSGGHIAYLNISKIPTGATYLENFCDSAGAMGGLAIYTHPYGVSNGKIADLNDALLARDMPIAVALGKAPVWDLPWAGKQSLAITDYYRYLNLGFHLGCTGWSDIDLNLRTTGPLSGCRTYCHPESLDWKAITKAYREGRTITTTGPWINLSCGSSSHGDTIVLNGNSPTNLTFTVEAAYLHGFSKIEIIHNGETAKTLVFEKEPRQIKENFSIPVSTSGWVAARTHGCKGNLFMNGWAHTSPVYVSLGSTKLKPKRADAEYFINWLQQYKAIIPRLAERIKEDKNTGKAIDWRQLEEVIDQAIAVYQKLTTTS
ncbi:MAG: CehA/McbA family metallohydrolase [Verrucomicrobiae bacterium]|nr:CehA/McbA family metallohydrolase [Verrucomicrobiae bacterium]